MLQELAAAVSGINTGGIYSCNKFEISQKPRFKVVGSRQISCQKEIELPVLLPRFSAVTFFLALFRPSPRLNWLLDLSFFLSFRTPVSANDPATRRSRSNRNRAPTSSPAPARRPTTTSSSPSSRTPPSRRPWELQAARAPRCRTRTPT